MKKVLALFLSLAMFSTLCACGSSLSKQEREYQAAQEAARSAEKAYQQALDDYNDLQRDIEAYQKAAEKLKGAY